MDKRASTGSSGTVPPPPGCTTRGRAVPAGRKAHPGAPARLHLCRRGSRLFQGLHGTDLNHGCQRWAHVLALRALHLTRPPATACLLLCGLRGEGGPDPPPPRAAGTGRPQHSVQLSRGPSLACRLTRNDRFGFSSIYSPIVTASLLRHVPSGKGVFKERKKTQFRKVAGKGRAGGGPPGHSVDGEGEREPGGGAEFSAWGEVVRQPGLWMALAAAGSWMSEDFKLNTEPGGAGGGGGTSLAVQWLRHRVSNAGDAGAIPVW